MIANLSRIIRNGFIGFWRNGIVSVASLLVFTVTLTIIGLLIFGSAVFDSALTQARDKVDVTVYFTLDALESDIKRLEAAVTGLPEVKDVTYKSQDEVLAEFKEKNKNDSLILQSLEELGDENPLRAELNIRAQDPSQFDVIVGYLQNEAIISKESGLNIIDKISSENETTKEAIDRFVAFTDAAEEFGIYLAIFAALIAVLVTFNTIRLAIYTAREEIHVMKLVGASDGYVRGPFIVEGIMYGVISTIFTLALLYPIAKWAGNATDDFFGSLNLFEYYISHLPFIFFTLLVVGTILGTISSILAVRRYLKA